MVIDNFRRIVLFVVLCLVQALVLNRIHLFGFAIPLLYVYLVVQMPYNYSKSLILLWGFFLGLCIDMFSNTPGVSTASLTLISALQPYLLLLFLPRDVEPNMSVSAHTLGWGKFGTFATVLTFVFCLSYFTLESLTFFNWLQWVENVVGSTLLTVLLIMTLENFRRQ